MIGVKRAALSIYGLDKSDREWILESLPVNDKEKVIDAIKYIDNLSIDTHGSTIAELVAEEIEITESGESGESENALFMQVDLVPVSIVSDVLSTEPNEIKRIVINFRDWNWKKEYLENEGKKLKGVGEVSVTDMAVSCIIDTFSNKVINHHVDMNSND